MKKKICFLLIIIPHFLSAQSDLRKIALEIEAEGVGARLCSNASQCQEVYRW